MKLFFLLVLLSMIIHSQEPRWPWTEIDCSDLFFPKTFLWGVATSAYQVEEEHTNNWSCFEKDRGMQRAGKACEHRRLLDNDIQCIKELGVKAYRFSIEWSAVEPSEGEFNKEAIEHYVRMGKKLRAQGIEPVVTLHHFTNPCWFETKGAFEKEENIAYFVRFCSIMFEAMQEDVSLWCTINEPGIYAFQGYFRGAWPPGYSMRLYRQSSVLINLLKAHCAVYDSLKHLPGGDKVKIGIVHSVVHFEPYHSSHDYIYHAESVVTKLLNSFVTTAVIDFFKTGSCSFAYTGASGFDEKAPRSLDFFGLNYYSQALIDLGDFNVLAGSDSAYRDGDIKTDMPYAIYAEGLYRAIVDVSCIGVPIYITENGCPDKDDTIRELWTARYLYALSRALREGYDVRGFFYWSLFDNFEWDMGYAQKFGLYAVDFSTQKRSLRKGSCYFQNIVKTFSV